VKSRIRSDSLAFAAPPHGQVAQSLDLIGDTLSTLDGVGNGKALTVVIARKVVRLLRDLET
jgi:hypothetical protein